MPTERVIDACQSLMNKTGVIRIAWDLIFEILHHTYNGEPTFTTKVLIDRLHETSERAIDLAGALTEYANALEQQEKSHRSAKKKTR